MLLSVMSRYILSMLFLLLFLDVKELSAQEENRWWQREVLTPSENQAINPRYLKKKRELEQAWDQLKQNRRAIAHFSSLGQKTTALKAAARSLRNIVRKFEHDLSLIPQYIPVSRPFNGQIKSPVTVIPRTTVIIPDNHSHPMNKSDIAPHGVDNGEIITLTTLRDQLIAHGFTVRSVGEILIEMHTEKGTRVRAVPSQHGNSALLFCEWSISRNTKHIEKMIEHILHAHPTFRARIESAPSTTDCFLVVETSLNNKQISTRPMLILRLSEIDIIKEYIREQL